MWIYFLWTKSSLHMFSLSEFCQLSTCKYKHYWELQPLVKLLLSGQTYITVKEGRGLRQPTWFLSRTALPLIINASFQSDSGEHRGQQLSFPFLLKWTKFNLSPVITRKGLLKEEKQVIFFSYRGKRWSL